MNDAIHMAGFVHNSIAKCCTAGCALTANTDPNPNSMAGQPCV